MTRSKYDDEIDSIAYVVRNTVEAVYFGPYHASFDPADILRNFCEPMFEGEGLFPELPDDIEPGEIGTIRLHLLQVISHAEKLLTECQAMVAK